MLPARVQEHASSHPHRTAIVAGADRLSYAELDRRVSELGGRLLGAGVARSALVGIHLDRGSDVVVSLLAVLSVGAAYLIVEPGESTAEGLVRLVLACPDLVLARPRDEPELALHGLRTLAPSAGVSDPAEPTDIAASDLAYVALTSGSTGVPKGVMVSHGNIQHYTEASLGRLGVTGPLGYAHVTTLAADLGNTSLFLALWTGGTLHLVDDAVRRDPRGLLRYLRDERVDVLKTTPSHWSAVFRAFGREPETSPELRFLLLGGELLGTPLARRILASGVTDSLVNHYGPTETTVGVAANVLRTAADLDHLGDAGSVPVGTALGATRLVIRTADGRWTDRDVVGELYVGGPSVSLGYRGDPAATVVAFPSDVPGLGRTYRTGDWVRADDRGVLEFLGRGDRQVKINGYRVELGHVETVLRRLPGVVDACAVQLHRDRPVLVAAVVLADPDAAGDLREQLRRELPAHMCPDRIEPLDAFPRTANGKIDAAEIRGLLERRAEERSGPAPETDDPVLADVIAAWQRHLGHGEFGVHDLFDRVGGNSLDAIQVVADLQAKGYAVSATTFMAEPSVGALAARLRTGQAAGEPAWAVDALPTDDSALSPSQQWFFRQGFAQPDHWNQMLLLDLDGAVSPTELTAAINDVVGLHPLLHTAFCPAAAGIRRVVVDAGRTVSASELPEGEDAVARHVQEVAAARQAEFNVTRGAVFRAHLFLGADRAALLLIGHHLCVDAVSWQTVINDISQCYSRRLNGDEPKAGLPSTGFGTWATYLRDHAEVLSSDLAHWDELANLPAIPAREGNCERDAQAVWFRLSQAETEALGRAATGVPLQAALIGAVATALADQQGDTDVLVDVENHGRAALDEALEMSRTVGWCTASFPIRVDVVRDLAGTIKAVAATLDEVPHLGIAYGLHARPQLADVCVNYLGPFSLPYGDDLRSAHSRIPVGPARARTTNARMP